MIIFNKYDQSNLYFNKINNIIKIIPISSFRIPFDTI